MFKSFCSAAKFGRRSYSDYIHRLDQTDNQKILRVKCSKSGTWIQEMYYKNSPQTHWTNWKEIEIPKGLWFSPAQLHRDPKVGPALIIRYEHGTLNHCHYIVDGAHHRDPESWDHTGKLIKAEYWVKGEKLDL